MGLGRGGIWGAAQWVCDLLGSRAAARNERGGSVEEAQDDAVYCIGARDRCRGR